MNRHLLLLVGIAFSSLIFSGCAKSRPQITYTQTEQPSKLSQMEASRSLQNQKIDNAYQNSKKCLSDLNESQIGKDVAKQILVLSDTQNNQFDLIKSKAKLSTEQKNILVKYLNANIVCREILLTGLSATPILTEQEKSNLAIDRIYGAMIGREITIGDGNLLLHHLQKAESSAFNIASNRFRREQTQAIIDERSRIRKASSENSPSNQSSMGNSPILFGSADEFDRPSKKSDSNFSNRIFEDIKKQQLIDETKRQMQMELDYEKKRQERIDFKTKSRQ